MNNDEITDLEKTKEISDRYRRVAKGFESRLSNTAISQYSLDTPCTDWNVEELICHVINTHFRVASQANNSETSEADQEADLHKQWERAESSIMDLLLDQDSAKKMITGMFGTQSFEELVGNLLCADTLFHTWDLARATGQDERLDSAATEKAFAFLEPLDEAIRRPGGFAPKITPAQGEDVLTRLLNFGGRSII